MKETIKLFSILSLVLILCFVIVSCNSNNNANESSSTSVATTSSHIEETTIISQIETSKETTIVSHSSFETIVTSIETTQIIDETTIDSTFETTNESTKESITETIVETTQETSINERVDFIDEKTIDVGSYVKLTYNPRYCDISSEVKKGIGKRETYTLTISMKDGYVFDGWSLNQKMSNNASNTRKNAESTSLTYTFNAQETTHVYANYSMTVNYHGNGGTIDGKSDVSELFSVSTLFCINTKPNEKNIVRDGYVLIGYNTKADGSGDFVSVGSKYYAGISSLDLYCVWIQNSPISDFEYEKSGNIIKIKKYKGNDNIVVVPEMIDGYYVSSIENTAFANKSLEKIVLPSQIMSVGTRAFYGCSNLKEIVCYDGITSFPDDAILKCTNFKTLRINATMQGYKWWGNVMYMKFDRLLALKDYKKIVLFGGSGTYEGWDSTQLEEAFGDEYEIVNFGMNASMTNLFQMEMFRYYLKEGDVLLWSPEAGSKSLGYGILFSPSTTTDPGDREMSFFSCNYDNIALLDVSKYSNILTHFALFNSLHKKAIENFEYSSAAVNLYGDYITERESKMLEYNYSFATVLNTESRYTEMANQIKYLKESGVKVYYTFACAQKGCASDEVLDKYISDIERIYGIESISDYHDLIFDIDMFFDSAWHMVLEGAYNRTKVVVEDLKRYI